MELLKTLILESFLIDQVIPPDRRRLWTAVLTIVQA